MLKSNENRLYQLRSCSNYKLPTDQVGTLKKEVSPKDQPAICTAIHSFKISNRKQEQHSNNNININKNNNNDNS
ncbi:hypothetical protein KIN20_018170 [Parelaphostrongylus tenuis]|uniref:Uncharacterized protein n=1 Tax=Parelaphostrongylus tenuis TaxID=148309 RepID=A0AAD5QS00_PARTN|nr:hypothetical protein KIN20_018170 [Parelaphostrongylus tenuis]